MRVHAPAKSACPLLPSQNRCKKAHVLITCYRWFDYFWTLCVGVETPTYKLDYCGLITQQAGLLVMSVHAPAKSACPLLPSQNRCKKAHVLITCYRWFDYFWTLCVGVETPTYKLSPVSSCPLLPSQNRHALTSCRSLAFRLCSRTSLQASLHSGLRIAPVVLRALPLRSYVAYR